MKRKRTWLYGGRAVVTYTKNEARAYFKKVLGLKRLPPDAEVFELIEEKD